MTLDRRLHAFRPDLAELALEGHVAAERFTAGEPGHVIEGLANLHKAPRADAGIDTQVLMGERLTVLDEDDEGWAWVKMARDGYVGYLPSHALMRGTPPAATHRVSSLRTFIYPAASIKEPPLGWLSFGSEVAIARETETNGRRYGVLPSGGAVVMAHLAPIASLEQDAVSVAERFLGTPYLWGGKSSLGIDCSGLVQTAFRAAGIMLPRDTDMQETAETGDTVALDPESWRRGDLLFWPGHVAIVRDADTMVHATAYTMSVIIEPTVPALERIAATGSPLRTVRRVTR